MDSIVTINNEISKHARRKELYQAMKLYDSVYSQGLANSHTFSSDINANVRCGNLDGAEKVFQKMKSTKGTKLDVISCTKVVLFMYLVMMLINLVKLLQMLFHIQQFIDHPYFVHFMVVYLIFYQQLMLQTQKILLMLAKRKFIMLLKITRRKLVKLLY